MVFRWGWRRCIGVDVVIDLLGQWPLCSGLCCICFGRGVGFVLLDQWPLVGVGVVLYYLWCWCCTVAMTVKFSWYCSRAGFGV